MESLPLAFSSGWASGVNCYLVVLVLGIADRVGDFSDIPDELASWPRLAIAYVHNAMEYVADKLLAGQVPEDTRLDQIVLAGVGGTTALLSHLSKAGLRLAVNSSPEPVSNIGISLLEDLAVLGVIAFAVVHPWIAAAIAGFLLVTGMVLLVVVARLARRGWRRWKGRRTASAGAGP